MKLKGLHDGSVTVCEIPVVRTLILSGFAAPRNNERIRPSNRSSNVWLLREVLFLGEDDRSQLRVAEVILIERFFHDY
jgi:hypothetical protein